MEYHQPHHFRFLFQDHHIILQDLQRGHHTIQQSLHLDHLILENQNTTTTILVNRIKILISQHRFEHQLEPNLKLCELYWEISEFQNSSIYPGYQVIEDQNKKNHHIIIILKNRHIIKKGQFLTSIQEQVCIMPLNNRN